MRQSRSFKEYVENNLDNQMWRAIEEFLPSVDPSVLDLRLNRVRNVGEIELYDTDLQFVDVSDLPGSAIEFDVVMDATLIIHDEDRYHNDESEAAHQWFMIRCRGDLDRKLSDLETMFACTTGGTTRNVRCPMRLFQSFIRMTWKRKRRLSCGSITKKHSFSRRGSIPLSWQDG